MFGGMKPQNSTPHRGSYRCDREWSDRFIPQIKSIVGPLLLSESPLEIDQKQAADLIVMRGRDMTIGCRVRRFGYAKKYGSQFTIRAARESGAETELSKITNGWGDWLFYGHSDEPGETIESWMVVDLAAWRAHLIRDKGSISHGMRPNGDGTHFAWFDIHSFGPTPSILVASSFEVAA